MRKREWGIRVGPAVPCKPPSLMWRWVMYFITRRWKNLLSRKSGVTLQMEPLTIIIGGIIYMTAAFWLIAYSMATSPESVWF